MNHCQKDSYTFSEDVLSTFDTFVLCRKCQRYSEEPEPLCRCRQMCKSCFDDMKTESESIRCMCGNYIN